LADQLPVSVVIATYNRAQACCAAVESVLAQRTPPMEIVVCDDASPSSAAEELRTWCASQPTVRFVGLTQNHGPAASRNAGVERARCEWIAFLDDDDRWLPGKLEAQWVEAKSGKWDLIAANAVRTDGSRFYNEPPPREPTYADLHAANPIVLSTVLARRARILEAGGFPQRRRHAEDYELWLALADRGACFLVLEEALVEYEDASAERLSAQLIPLQWSIASLASRRWLRSPWDPPRAKAAARESVKLARFLVGRAMRR
jgi:glycosyltransferase involved in cell wall biosynthesis